MARFPEMPIPVQFFLSFVIMLGLSSAALWATRRFAGTPRGLQAWIRFAGAPGSSQSRLTVIDYASVRGRRRLVLVRRDDVEHLVLIGGATDVVVESNIAAAALQQAEDAPDPYSGDPRRRVVKQLPPYGS